MCARVFVHWAEELDDRHNLIATTRVFTFSGANDAIVFQNAGALDDAADRCTNQRGPHDVGARAA